MATNLTADDRAQLSRVWDELTNALRIVEHLLGDDDPTGLRYDRGDAEEPVLPVPPHVDGLSITGRPPRRSTNAPAGFTVSPRPGSEQGAAALGDVAAPAPGGVR